MHRVATENHRTDIQKLPYVCPDYVVEDGITYLRSGLHGNTPLRVFGRHNLLNLTAARLACRQVGVTDKQFDAAISSFDGASKRLELVKSNANCAVYKDFAHAPSKLRATIHAMREQYPDRKLIACMELHTFSSLTQEFLQQYRGTMDKADIRFVYYSKHALQLKKLPDLDPVQVKAAFGNNIEVFTDSKIMVDKILSLFRTNGNMPTNLLMMSSGNFDGIDFNQLANTILTD